MKHLNQFKDDFLKAGADLERKQAQEEKRARRAAKRPR